MTEKEEILQALKDLLAKQDYSRAAAIISSEKLDSNSIKSTMIFPLK